MARGYDEHQQRLAALNALGRSLARRARSRCELCATSGATLHLHEVSPVPDEPALERTLFLCPVCRDGLAGSAAVDPRHWHCLRESVWSEIPAVQVVAVRQLRELARDPRATWASETLERLFLDPDVEAWIDDRRA